MSTSIVTEAAGRPGGNLASNCPSRYGEQRFTRSSCDIPRLLGRTGGILLTVVVVGAVVVGGLFSGTAIAHEGPEVGASGNCDDGENGGGGDVIYEVGTVDNPVNETDVRGIASGAGWYAESIVIEGNGPDDACEPDSDGGDQHSEDWVEVHAHDGGFGASPASSGGSAGTFSSPNHYQVCYDGDTHVVVGNDPECPTAYEDR